jgi:methylphosphotriester-DNA--protein-cysteine methyltransferase
MRISSFSPRVELAPFVRSFTLIETRDEATRTLLPDTGMVLGIRYGGFACQLDQDPTRRLPDASLAGMRASARRMYTSAGAGVVLATFQTGGAVAFFSEPLHELFGKTAPLDEVLPASELERAANRVAEAREPRQRVAAVEGLLLERLRRNGDRVVGAAIRAINDARGAIRIGELAHALSLSRDRLEKRFRHAVGASPKQLASILRVRHAIDLHRAGSSLTDAALDAGYFDQSHFIREFRLFTGDAPRRFFRNVEHC